MSERSQKLDTLILRHISASNDPIGSLKLRQHLSVHGVQLEPRAIRLHLRRLDEEGLTHLVSRRAGRHITDEGRRYLARAGATERVGLSSVRLEDLGVRLALERTDRFLAANFAVFPRAYMARAMEDMRPVFTRRLCAGTLIAGGDEKQELPGGAAVPEGHVALATPCSVCLAAVLLREGIPAALRFGGLLEYHEGRPRRFVELIEYQGSSLDPAALFVRARLTSVRRCALEGRGVITASFREIPGAAAAAARRVARQMERSHLWGVIAVGEPGRPLFDIPVSEGRCGLVLAAGLNPFAALCEVRRDVEIRPAAGLIPRENFQPFELFRQHWPG